MKLPILPSASLVKQCAAALCAFILVAPTARATWSICVVNTETGEVCVATATCLTGLDLQLAVPVLRVGQGAGAAQAFLYAQGKVIMWNGFIAGDTPAQILADIDASDGAHQFRQYGIVDMLNHVKHRDEINLAAGYRLTHLHTLAEHLVPFALKSFDGAGVQFEAVDI